MGECKNKAQVDEGKLVQRENLNVDFIAAWNVLNEITNEWENVWKRAAR